MPWSRKRAGKGTQATGPASTSATPETRAALPDVPAALRTEDIHRLPWRYTLPPPSRLARCFAVTFEAAGRGNDSLESLSAPPRRGAAGAAFQHLDTPAAGGRGRRSLRLLAPNRYVVDWVNQNCAQRIGELVDDWCRRRRPRSCSRSARGAPTPPRAALPARAPDRATKRAPALPRSAAGSTRISRSATSSRARATSSPRRGDAGRGESRPRLQPAVHLRRRRPRQDAPDARGRQHDPRRATRTRASPTCIPSASSATWCGRCSTTRSTSSRRPIARSTRC